MGSIISLIIFDWKWDPIEDENTSCKLVDNSLLIILKIKVVGSYNVKHNNFTVGLWYQIIIEET